MDALSSVEFNNQIYNAAMSAAIGGTVSVLTGGKFKNGAVSAAFSRMLNDGIEGFSENVGVNRYSKVYWKRMHDEKTNMPIQEIRMVKAKWNPIWGLNDLLEAAVGKRMVIDYQYLTKDYYIYEKYDEFKYYETYSVSDSTLLHVSEAIPTGKVKWINTGILHHRSVADIRACPVNCDVSDLRGVLGKDD